MDGLPDERILGERVMLRAPDRRDADPIAAACNDPAVQRFLHVLPTPYRRADALAWIESAPAHRQRGGASFAIVDPATDQLLGSIALNDVSAGAGSGEIGYWVAPWARGRGVATDAARALTGWSHAHGIGRLTLYTELENWPSQRVALACGYRREGVARGRGVSRGGGRHDHVTWARVTDDPVPAPRLLPDLPGPPGPDGTPTRPGAYGYLADGVVTLRPLWEPDAPAMYELDNLPDVVATSVPPRAPTWEQVVQRCARSYGRWLAGERCEVAILDAASGEFAGQLGLFYQEPPTLQAMLGYGMLPRFRGRGLMTRAVRLLTGWAFAQVGLARIVAGTAPGNLGSQAVLERAGFTREAYLRSRLPGADGTRVDDIQWVLFPPGTPTPPGSTG
jgi:RimJ/RimL family protein N-acetyltransferase